MKRWLALSVAAHVLIVVALGSRSTAVVAVAVAVAPAPPPPPEIIEVEFFADSPRVTTMPLARPGTGPSSARTVVTNPIETSAIAANLPTSLEGAAPPRPSEVVIPSIPTAAAAASRIESQNYFGMRERPAPTTPTAAPPSAFTVQVSPDGTAHITNRRNAQIATGAEATHEREVSQAEYWLEEHHERSNAIEMKVPSVGPTVVTFDLTDAAMRLAGQDPYAFEKLKVLDATREQRVQIGARHRELQVIQTPALVRANLDDIAKLPAPQRQKALAELWHDLDHSASGDVARATIATYVGAHDIFTIAERALVAP